MKPLEQKPGPFHPFYMGYFDCFNAGDYYEAHNVLESLWLDCRDANNTYYKGLIQIAGAFVHLKKQHERPNHPTDGRRLYPAVRLFSLGLSNVEPFGSYHLGLDILAVCTMCRERIALIEKSKFSVNPWRPGEGPRLRLASA
jgi:hypothetical protein